MSEQGKDSVIGYFLTLPDLGDGPWLFLGTTPAQVAESITNHLDGNEGMVVSEIDAMRIEARWVTQDELDNMPDFPGW